MCVCDVASVVGVQVPLSDYFPDYDGGYDYRAGYDFISEMFLKANHSDDKEVVVHATCATDTDNAAAVWNAVKVHIIVLTAIVFSTKAIENVYFAGPDNSSRPYSSWSRLISDTGVLRVLALSSCEVMALERSLVSIPAAAYATAWCSCETIWATTGTTMAVT